MKFRNALAMILVVIMAFASFPAFAEKAEECKHVNKTVLDEVKSTHFIEGNILYKCLDCGIRIEETQPVTGHDWGTGKVTVPPTCEEEGEIEYTCQIEGCTENKTEAIQNLGGHKYEEKSFAATCQSAAYTAMFCPKCGAVDENTIEYEENGEKADHDWDKGEVTAEATCCAPGEIVYTCQTEGCTETKTEEIEKLECAYEEEGTITKEATCTEKGEIVYECTCDDENCTCEPKVEAVDTLPHTFELAEDKCVEATCEEGGYDLYVCSVCGAEEKRNETEALGHTKKVVETVAPTCEKAGYTLYECEECETVFADDMTAALGHKLVKVAKVKATCDKEGIEKCWQCSVCEKYFDSDKEDAAEIEKPVIEKTAHTEKSVDNREATCGEVGYENVVMCEACGAVISGTVIPALDHSNTTHVEAVKATCLEAGNVEYWYCNDCGKYFGSYNEKTKVYSKELIVDEENEIDQTVAPALGDNVVTVAAVAASCEKNGTTEWSYCSRCGEILTAPKTVVFHEDKANQKPVEDIAATCTAPGSKHIECTVCGVQISENLTIPMLAHDFVEYPKVEATCTEDGHEAYFACSMCEALGVKDEKTGKITLAEDAEIKVIPAAHKPEIVKGVEPTCTEKGLSDYSVCSVSGCGIVTTEQVEIEALGHTFEEDSTICKVCGFDSEAELAAPDYAISARFSADGANGSVTLKEGCEEAETLYARVTVWFEDASGDLYFLVLRDKVVDGKFDVGYNVNGTVVGITVVLTDKASCASTPIGDISGEHKFGSAEF